MSAGEVAGLVAALAFVVLVGLLALPLLRLARTLDEARRSIARLTDEAVPTLRATSTTVESVNGTLTRADGITADVGEMTGNASALTSLLASVVGGPAVKVSAFSYGVRRAVGHRRQASPAAQRAQTLERVRARREQRAHRQRGAA